MRETPCLLDQALSLTQGNELTTALSLKKLLAISLSALNDYVAASSQQRVPPALSCL